MEHGQPNWPTDAHDEGNDNAPRIKAPQGRHSDPFESIEYELDQAESPAEAIPAMPEGVYRLGVEIEDSLNAQTQADVSALEAAQSILDPDVLPNQEPTRTSENQNSEWFGGLTETDNPLDEKRPVERVNPFRPIPGRPAIESYLTWVVQNEGSDLHISAGEVPWVRIYGNLHPVKNVPILTDDEMTLLAAEVLNDKEATIFAETRDIDTAYSMSEKDGAPITSRFRVNVFVTMEKIGMVIRVIPTQVKTIDELKLLPVVKQLAKLPRGLVLVTGPTGSGKSLPLGTSIPTPDGYTTMGELKEGDYVIGRNGQPCRVTNLLPINETPEIFRVTFSDGQTIDCDIEHQWLVSSHHNRNVPRTKKRVKAIEHHESAHADAQRLEALSHTYTVAIEKTAKTAREIFDLLTENSLTKEFPSPYSVAAGLGMTDCPSWLEQRDTHIGIVNVARSEPVNYFPTEQILQCIASSRSHRSKLAQRLLENDIPAETTCEQIGQMLGGAPHSVARYAIASLGLKGRLGEQQNDYNLSPTRNIHNRVYPLDIALKSLALRLEQRFSTAPSSTALLSRMTVAEMVAAGLEIKGTTNFAIPVVAALQFPEADLPISPYVFGAWLGDGHTSGGRITSDNKENLSDAEHKSDQAYMIEQIVADGFDCHKEPSSDFVVSVSGLHSALKSAGVFGNKHIPMPFLRASHTQRLALLQGLMDTDGTIDVNGNCELSLSDELLANDALDLIRSLGIKASKTVAPSSYLSDNGERVECKDRHRIHFTTTTQVFSLPRKAVRTPDTVRETQGWLYVKSIEPMVSEPARCITVDSPDHTYLCGNGYVVTSNSTTMAAIVDLINTTREERIFTFEDPVEFTHKSKRSLISHREIGTDTESFPAGLRAVLREDPDIILIGEMRDNATIRAAIESADAGHYVLATLHTSSAYETVGRIINTFPEEEQNQIRVTLASILRAVICQTLVPSAQAYMGRVVASEIMIVTPGIQNNIRENDLPAIRNALSDTTHGSISLDAHLAQLINSGKITKREALKKATSPKALERQLGSGEDGNLI